MGSAGFPVSLSRLVCLYCVPLVLLLIVGCRWWRRLGGREISQGVDTAKGRFNGDGARHEERTEGETNWEEEEEEEEEINMTRMRQADDSRHIQS